MLVLELKVGESISVGTYEVHGIAKSKHGIRIGFANVPKSVPIVRSDALRRQHEGPLEPDGGPPGMPELAPTVRVDDDTVLGEDFA